MADHARTRNTLAILVSALLAAALCGCGTAEKAPNPASETKPATEGSIKQEGKQGGMVPDFSIDR
jgi:hypothetical protein